MLLFTHGKFLLALFCRMTSSIPSAGIFAPQLCLGQLLCRSFPAPSPSINITFCVLRDKDPSFTLKIHLASAGHESSSDEPKFIRFA